jgi:hypothetical protein
MLALFRIARHAGRGRPVGIAVEADEEAPGASGRLTSTDVECSAVGGRNHPISRLKPLKSLDWRQATPRAAALPLGLLP